MLRVGIDTGGTFTDFVVVKDGEVFTWKEPSTPDDPSRAILEGLAKVASAMGGLRGDADVVHGSTVATNALLEAKTARIAFVTNEGFEDLLEIGRQARPDLYDIEGRKPPALAPRELRFGIGGRILVDGSELAPVDRAQVEKLGSTLAEEEVEAVAVCLLHSYADPRHEEQVRDILVSRGLMVSISSEIVREHREYERASTVAVNAAVAPVVSRYLDRLSSGLRNLDSLTVRGLRVMGSNGGALSAEAAGRQAARTVLSGPAAGVRAAESIGRALERARLISFDMGGTSTDVSLIPERARATTETIVAGYPVKIPTIDIHTVGAGGGSIAWRDPGGALRVGPASAGAVPGPACYGAGGPPTVTDANLVLGRLVPGRFLGGRMHLDEDAGRRAVGDLAAKLGLGLEEAAAGIVEVAEAAMARAIRVISLHRGHEPADFALLAFGGAGGLHAASLARSLGIARVIIPGEPGVFSAYGMTEADVMRDRSMTLIVDAASTPHAAIERLFEELERTCARDLLEDGMAEDRIGFVRGVDARYRGQAFELGVPYLPGGGWVGSFHDEHLRRFGYCRADKPVELVTLRVTGLGGLEAAEVRPIDPSGRSLEASHQGTRRVRLDGGEVEAAVHDRSLLPPATPDGGEAGRVAGPALIVEPGATTLIPPGWSGWLDARGPLRLEAGR